MSPPAAVPPCAIFQYPWLSPGSVDANIRKFFVFFSKKASTKPFFEKTPKTSDYQGAKMTTAALG
jgi:hypothetical protein